MVNAHALNVNLMLPKKERTAIGSLLAVASACRPMCSLS